MRQRGRRKEKVRDGFYALQNELIYHIGLACQDAVLAFGRLGFSI